MTDEEIESRARVLQAEGYPFGPPRPAQPWAILKEESREFWREKARAGVQPGQAAAEAEVIKRARGDYDVRPTSTFKTR